MEIKFTSRQQGGAGIYVITDMELVDTNLLGSYEDVAPGIGILFDEKIQSVFKNGAKYIKKVILDNYEHIMGKIGYNKVLFIRSASADLVYYDPIVFLGATIKWLNTYAGTKIEIPEYKFDWATRTFSV